MTDLKKLAERIKAAIDRITSGHGEMRIPAEQTDPDLVLMDCQNAIYALQEEVAMLLEENIKLRRLATVREVLMEEYKRRLQQRTGDVAGGPALNRSEAERAAIQEESNA